VQAVRRVDRSQAGLGLGLAQVKKVAELHGGTVEAFSAGVGQGSEFVVCLPCVRQTAVESNVHFEPEDTKAPPTRILAADDDLDSADCLARLLKIAGHELRVAYDGPTAMALAINFTLVAIASWGHQRISEGQEKLGLTTICSNRSSLKLCNNQ
jgi:two-component system, sensor histidine kinase